MAKQNNNAAATVAALKTEWETALAEYDALEAALEVREAAQAKIDNATAEFNALAADATAEAREAAQAKIDAAVAEFNALVVSPEVKAAAQKKVDDALAAYEAATAPKQKEKKLKGVFVVSPTGKYNLAYNVGESAELPELQALELEEAGFFKLDK